jgi:hypothetical protein
MIPLPPYLDKIRIVLLYLSLPILMFALVYSIIFNSFSGFISLIYIIIGSLYLIVGVSIAVLRHLFVEVDVHDRS